MSCVSRASVRALQLPVRAGNRDGVLHQLLDRAGEPGIEAAFERDRRDNRNQNRRKDRHEAEKTDDSDVKSSRRRAGPTLADQPSVPARRRCR